MVIAEINETPGVLGFQIQVFIRDGAPDPKTYNEKAPELVIKDEVPSLSAPRTPAGRKVVLPVVERWHSRLRYPTCYEGVGRLKTVASRGMVPSRHLSSIIPYIIKVQIKENVSIVFLNYSHSQGHDKLSIYPTVIFEIEIAAAVPEDAVASQACFRYSTAVNTDANERFVERCREFVKDPKAFSHHALKFFHFRVHPWKHTMEKPMEVSAIPIRNTLVGRTHPAPGRKIEIDPENQHTWLTLRIARNRCGNQGKIIDAHTMPAMPLPHGATGIIQALFLKVIMLGVYVTALVGFTLHSTILVTIRLAARFTGMVGRAIERVVMRQLYGMFLDTLLVTGESRC